MLEDIHKLYTDIMPSYIRGLSICSFGYLQGICGVLEPMPQRFRGRTATSAPHTKPTHLQGGCTGKSSLPEDHQVLAKAAEGCASAFRVSGDGQRKQKLTVSISLTCLMDLLPTHKSLLFSFSNLT
jgi:hypothetical protein